MNQFTKYILFKTVKINNTNINRSIFALENNKKEEGLRIDNIIMVNLGNDGKPALHGKTKVEFVSDRLK